MHYIGGGADEQKEFVDALGGFTSDSRKQNRRPPVANEFALGYTYLDVLDAEQEGSESTIYPCSSHRSRTADNPLAFLSTFRRPGPLRTLPRIVAHPRLLAPPQTAIHTRVTPRHAGRPTARLADTLDLAPTDETVDKITPKHILPAGR